MGDKNNSKNGLIGFFQQVRAGVSAFFIAVSAIVGYIKLAEGDFDLFTLVLLGVCVAGSFLFCFYYAFIWKPELGDGKSTESVIITPGSNKPIVSQGKKEKHRKRKRCLARLGLLLIPVLVWVGYRFYQHQVSLPPKDFKILVANFEGSDSTDHRVTQEIFRNLEQELERYGDDVKVERLDKSLKSIRAAKAVGKQEKAVIVIWGDYQVLEDVVPISVNFQILKETTDYFELGESVQGKTQTAQLSQLNSFKLQTNLSQEMTYLSLFTLGMYRYLDEDWEQAQTFYNQSLKALQTSNEPINSLEREVIYFYLGNSFSFIERYEEVIASYDQAIKIKPDLYEAWSNRGVALSNLGRNEEAIASYDQAIKFKPDYHKAWSNRGNAMDELGRYEEAITSYDQAIKFKPDYREAWSNRGVAMVNLGRNEEAIISYDQAIKFKPDYANAYFGKGFTNKVLGNNKAAIENFTQASELYKKQGNSEWYQNSLDRLKELEN